MCGLAASGARLAKRYNPRFRAKDGFFNPKHMPTTLSRLPVEPATKRQRPHSACTNYAHHVATLREKPEDLAQTIAKLFAERAGQKVCVYASNRNARVVLQASSSIQRFPEKRPEQVLMRRRFRKGNFVIMLSDDDVGTLPSPDTVVHYDLPKSPEVLRKRCQPQHANIFFYLSHEKVLVAHLQNSLNCIMTKWGLPSKSDQAEAFLDHLSTVVDSMQLLPVNVEHGDAGQRDSELVLFIFLKHNVCSALAALLYFAYRKHAHSKKQYLLHDPGFERFKTRRDVEQYLSENGISNYTGITLTRRGFVVESYDMLRHPIVHGSTPELPGIRRIRERVNSGYISSHKGKTLVGSLTCTMHRRKAFNILAKAHERKMIRMFKFKRSG
ncbi:cytidylate kinase, putative [Babesia ovata]|uniref:Cytidylate kinase, putative n=1 Tax=Babesia ovata TaxID=189622 RepID=A0A2H6KDA8_9APIC|nr:cytidylate kinase, putative [Babesia ovata]GBE60975.1 cytidylate kinase, putative [Babesia ovata]